MKKTIFLFLVCISPLNIAAASAIAQLTITGDSKKDLADAANLGRLAAAFEQSRHGFTPDSESPLSEIQRLRLAQKAAALEAANFAHRSKLAQQEGQLARETIAARDGTYIDQWQQACQTGALAKATIEARDGTDYKLREIAQSAATTLVMTGGQAISANNDRAALTNFAMAAASANIAINGNSPKNIAIALFVAALPTLPPLANNIHSLIPSIRKDNKFVRPYYPKKALSMAEMIASIQEQTAANQYQESILKNKKLELEMTLLQRTNLEKTIAANNPETETDQKQKTLKAKIKAKAQEKLLVLDAITSGLISLKDMDDNVDETAESATKAA